MIQLNSITAIDAMLKHIHGLMTQAERTDVHAFLHLTDQYAKMYCLKLRMTK
jgi:REP element-mobilizing transposase RayT